MSMHQIEIERILSRRFGEMFDKAETTVDCPFCGGSKKLWINVAKKLVHCFKCNYGSGVAHFLKKIGETVESAVLSDPNWAAVNEDVDIAKHVEKILTGIVKSEAKPQESLALPDNVRYFEKIGELGKMALDYLRYRGIFMSHIQKYKLGYCATGKYGGRIIIPVFMDGKLVYFQGRTYYKNTPRKYLNPAVGKVSVLYNYDCLAENSRVVIVEGTFDAIKGGDGFVAILGKSMSAQQRRALIKKRPSEIVLMLDPDALTDAMELAKELRVIAPVRVVTKHNRDAGSMSYEEIMVYVKGAEPANILSHVETIIRKPRKF